MIKISLNLSLALFILGVLLLAFSAAACENSTSYKRSLYLKKWDRNVAGCRDTRNEVLRRDAVYGSVRFKTARQCKVVSGVWHDPYTGYRITSPSRIHIDHGVPLLNIHKSGGCKLSPSQRRAMANDMSNLLAVYSRSNLRKGAKTPLTWLPEINRCTYLLWWQNTKIRFGLTLSKAEVRFIRNYQGCDWR